MPVSVIEKHTAATSLGEAESLSEAKLSVLRELADSLGVSLGELLKALALVIPAFGGPDMDEPPNFTDHEVKIEPGTCPAPATRVEDTTVLTEAVGEEKPTVIEEDGTVWNEGDCPSIMAYIADIQNELGKEGLNDLDKAKLLERLKFFLSTKAVLKCEGEYPLIEGDTREK